MKCVYCPYYIEGYLFNRCGIFFDEDFMPEENCEAVNDDGTINEDKIKDIENEKEFKEENEQKSYNAGDIKLWPSDKVYVVIDVEKKCIAKARIQKVTIDEDMIQYSALIGKPIGINKCENYYSYLFFYNKNIDTGVGVVKYANNKYEYHVFTTKEKCLEFLGVKSGNEDKE